jgi:hypothetical protein
MNNSNFFPIFVWNNSHLIYSLQFFHFQVLPRLFFVYSCIHVHHSKY